MDPLFSHGKKRISDSEISNRDAKKISGELGFNHASERCEFEEALHGPVTREKIHDKLQEMVAKGKITEKKAKSVINQLGIERKDLRTFEDVSEWKKNHHLEKSEEPQSADIEKRKTESSTAANNLSQNASQSDFEKANTDKKPKSIWSILNKR